MDKYTREFEIIVAYLQLQSSTLCKMVKKSGQISYWKKPRLSEHVPQVVKHLFTVLFLQVW